LEFEKREMVKAMRSMKTAKLTFGLVTIDCKVYKATEGSSGTGLNQFHTDEGCQHKKEQGRIRQIKTCASCNKTLSKDQIVRGTAIQGKVVTVTDDEVKGLRPEKSAAISINEFVSAHEIPPVYFKEQYYLGVDKKGVIKPFFLLREAMKQCGRIAIATVTMQTREYVCAIEPYKTGFLLSTLHYESEVRDISELAVEEMAVSDEELKLARELIDQNTKAELDLSQYADSFGSELNKLLKSKAEGIAFVSDDIEHVEATTDNFVDVLKASINAGMLAKVEA